MAGFCTNLDLFVKLRSGGDLKNHMFLYESIISVLTTEVSEEDKNRIKEFCRLFCVNLNKKWIESSRNQKTFMNRVINRKWLEKNINWPVYDSVDLRSVMGFSDAALSELVDIDCHVPTLAVCTAEAGTSTEKEHRKPFEELSNKQKKRRSTSIVEENSEEELQHWYITKLKDNGKTNLAKVVEYLSSNPDALSEVEERLFKKQSLSTVSEDKCLALYTSVALSKWKYLALRQFLKEEKCAAFPSYPKLVNAKKRCYPPQESMEITENGAHIKLQALLDHTVERILLDINTVDRSQNEELKLTWKWGLDGSSSQSNYKQKTSNTATEFDDSSVVMISIVPLRLVSTRPSSGNENLVWENPTPCSTLYCRPVKFTFTSETADFIKSEESEMKKQIDERISTQCGNIIVSHELHMTMIDGKVANIIAGVPSYATCPICLAKPSEMNNLDALTSKPLREEIYKQGISSLHMKIRCMECLLHISYNLDFQRWTARGEHKALKQAKKNTTQQEFREQTGMLIDIVKQGFGTTNDGNTARRFFQDYKRSSRITGIDENLIFRFSVILQAISSGKNIDCEKFRRYCRETADVYVQHYSWYYMPVSVHKLLMHGADICNHFGVLPIGTLSEEASEARNKDFRNVRERHTRKTGRIATNEDILHGLLISSDPHISYIRPKIMKQVHNELLPEATQLLQTTEPPCDSEIMEEEECLIAESENLPDPLALLEQEIM